VDDYLYLDVLVSALAIVSLLLTFKYIYEVSELYNEKMVTEGKEGYRRPYKEQKRAVREIRK
jgi:hypothetical protein